MSKTVAGVYVGGVAGGHMTRSALALGLCAALFLAGWWAGRTESCGLLRAPRKED